MIIGYTNREISLVNRVYNATTAIASPHQAVGDKPEFEYEAPGVSAIAAALWFESSRVTDWSADTDIALEVSPFVDAVWSRTYLVDEGPLMDIVDNAIELLANFENRVWLASTVVNAMRALEGAIDLIWQDEKATEAVNREFAGERESLRRQVRALFYDYVERGDGDPDDAWIKELLAKSDDEIREEKRARNPLPRINPTEGIPTIWEVFAEIRAIRDDLKGRYVNEGTDVVLDAVDRLTRIGDYDEPLTGFITDALDHKNEAIVGLKDLADEERKTGELD